MIAFIDSGLRGTHQEYLGKQLTGCDFSLGQSPCTPIAPNAVSDACGHGSETTSLGAGGTNNGVGMASTGFNSAIMVVKLIRDDCNVSSTVSKADPIRYAYNNGAHVINMSYGGTVYDGPEADAITTAWTVVGVSVVAAAGNDGNSSYNYPCADSYVICVGESDNTGARQLESNYGSWVDFSAPGMAGVWTATNATDSSYQSVDHGTSLSAPEVAGICALLKSIGKAPDAQMNALVGTSIRDTGWTAYGFVQAGEALWAP